MVATQAGFELESVEYRQDPEMHRFRYDQDTTSPGMAVVAALSEVTDTDPTVLEPLNDTVDVGALDALVTSRDTANGDVRVTLTYSEYTVTVHSYGVVAVAPMVLERTDARNGKLGHE